MDSKQEVQKLINSCEIELTHAMDLVLGIERLFYLFRQETGHIDEATITQYHVLDTQRIEYLEKFISLKKELQSNKNSDLSLLSQKFKDLYASIQNLSSKNISNDTETDEHTLFTLLESIKNQAKESDINIGLAGFVDTEFDDDDDSTPRSSYGH